MITIRNTLRQFLAETSEGNRRSMSSPFLIFRHQIEGRDGHLQDRLTTINSREMPDDHPGRSVPQLVSMIK